MKLVMRLTLLTLLASLAASAAHAYPIDGYADTGIRRVEGARMANEGLAKGSKQPPGGLLTTEQVDLRLLDHKNLDLPEPDPKFTAELLKLLGDNASSYGIAVLDLSNPDEPRYAEHRGDFRQNVGSVGKLVVALGLFQALADTWPEDTGQRVRVLRDTLVTADAFSRSDHHKIRIFDVENRKLTRRTMKIGDQGTLWEFLDWTLSVSSNSAAAMTMREAMLLRQYGKDYPPSEQEIARFFKETPGKELTALYQRTFFDPITRNGLDIENLRQGSFFTHQGKRLVNGGGNSYGTARSLMEFTLRLEQGRLVDEFSSRQIKRLLYMTERRIRYASSPALGDSAVYFKSGSLYSCQKEEGFTCRPYMGNRKNHMNSVAIVESPAGEHRLHYMSTLVSNVLRKNSAVDHQTMGTRIHRLIEKAHPAPKPKAVISSPVPVPPDRAGEQQVPPATSPPSSPPQDRQ
jgi:hypothetical protein